MVTDEKVEKALALVAKGGGNYEYFFSKLTSPDWIAPLQRRVGSRILLQDSWGQFHSFPPWPEGDYLVRMAPSHPKRYSERSKL